MKWLWNPVDDLWRTFASTTLKLVVVAKNYDDAHYLDV